VTPISFLLRQLCFQQESPHESHCIVPSGFCLCMSCCSFFKAHHALPPSHFCQDDAVSIRKVPTPPFSSPFAGPSLSSSPVLDSELTHLFSPLSSFFLKSPTGPSLSSFPVLDPERARSHLLSPRSSLFLSNFPVLDQVRAAVPPTHWHF
jgi:hypothetical protein